MHYDISLQVLVESATSDLFEYFMMSFCRHLDQSGCTLPPNIVEKSAYMTLLSDYVCFMMPVNNQFQIATKEAQNSARRSTLNSPLNLFKEVTYCFFKVIYSLLVAKNYSREIW